MGTELHLRCGGCDATAEGVKSLNRASNVAECIPEGWVWKDPYTHCTYCPKCWAEIEEAP